jgi:hypothetical protein
MWGKGASIELSLRQSPSRLYANEPLRMGGTSGTIWKPQKSLKQQIANTLLPIDLLVVLGQRSTDRDNAPSPQVWDILQRPPSVRRVL